MYAVYPGSELSEYDRIRYKELFIVLVPIFGLLGTPDEICRIYKDENPTINLSNKEIKEYLNF